MNRFRALAWTVMTAAGLMLSLSHGFAQQPNDADQPGLIADDSYQLDPEWQKQMVLPHHRAARHHHHLDSRPPSLPGAAWWPRPSIRHRRRPRRFPVARASEHQPQGR